MHFASFLPHSAALTCFGQRLIRLLDKIAACLVDGDKSTFSNFPQTRIKQLGR
ncbi:hypothetical protein T08_6867 [Trichinella sp. T8]|nr:hypothetical protein T08_6867 [Trichinella sp. T8]